MCDTIIARGNVTADGATLFAKNSDREPNEAHHIVVIPAADHAPSSRVQCTYIEIPQVAHTHRVLLCKPFWIWGAEMGANEHGVVIGNEAVFTKIPYAKTPGLIGMDFLRLALERAQTARAALDVITALLAQYGQSGNCGYQHATYYHNGFLIADPHNAWVLETADKHWAAERVQDIRTISNGLTIGNQFDLASPDLVKYAVARGWCQSRDDFHFARCYSDFLFTRFSQSRARQCRTTAQLAAQRGKITIETMTRALRDHGDDANWSPARGIASFDVCAHAGWGPIRGTQTTGSLVAHLTPTAQTHFVTGTAAPCTSIFKPVWLDSGVLHAAEPAPTGEYDAATLFWRHEQLHRATLRDYATLSALYRDERDALERRFIADAPAWREQSREDRLAYSVGAFAQADAAEKQWTAHVLARAGKSRNGFLYDAEWRAFNRAAGINP